MYILAMSKAGRHDRNASLDYCIIRFMYFFMARPQKQEQKRKEAMRADLAIGDTVLTTSGFYGTVIDINDDTVIIEFGNNKNCLYPCSEISNFSRRKTGRCSRRVQIKSGHADRMLDNGKQTSFRRRLFCFYFLFHTVIEYIKKNNNNSC